MEVSEHFKQALFYEQNSTTDTFFEERADKLFELDKTKSFVEVAFHRLPHGVLRTGGLSHRVRAPEIAPGSSFVFTSHISLFWSRLVVHIHSHGTKKLLGQITRKYKMLRN